MCFWSMLCYYCYYSMKTFFHWNGCPLLWRTHFLKGVSQWRKWSNHHHHVWPLRRILCITNSRHRVLFLSLKAAVHPLVERRRRQQQGFTSLCLVDVHAPSVHVLQLSTLVPPCSLFPLLPLLLGRMCRLMLSLPRRGLRILTILPSLKLWPRNQSCLLENLRRKRRSRCHFLLLLLTAAIRMVRYLLGNACIVK